MTIQSTAVIVLTILNDNIAELPEVTYIHLIEIVQSGSTDADKGAVIGEVFLYNIGRHISI